MKRTETHRVGERGTDHTTASSQRSHSHQADHEDEHIEPVASTEATERFPDESVKVERASQAERRDRDFADVPVSDLLRPFEDYTDVEAQRLIAPFVGNWIKVSGAVDNITIRERTSCVVFRSRFTEQVYAYFEKTSVNDRRLSMMRRGDPLTIVGQIDHASTFTLVLENCEFVEHIP